MEFLTREEIERLRSDLAGRSGPQPVETDVMRRLLDQASYALDASALLHDVCYSPHEPYGEAAELVARLTIGVNELWNKYNY